MRTRENVESCRHVYVAWSWQSLRHNVRQQSRRLEILKLDFAALDLITDVVILYVDVFCAAVVDRILLHLDARLVVFTDYELDPF